MGSRLKQVRSQSETSSFCLNEANTPALRTQPPIWSLCETVLLCSRDEKRGSEGQRALQVDPEPPARLPLPQSLPCWWRPAGPVTRSSWLGEGSAPRRVSASTFDLLRRGGRAGYGLKHRHVPVPPSLQSVSQLFTRDPTTTTATKEAKK